jgi:hypothetical protein
MRWFPLRFPRRSLHSTSSPPPSSLPSLSRRDDPSSRLDPRTPPAAAPSRGSHRSRSSGRSNTSSVRRAPPGEADRAVRAGAQGSGAGRGRGTARPPLARSASEPRLAQVGAKAAGRLRGVRADGRGRNFGCVCVGACGCGCLCACVCVCMHLLIAYPDLVLSQ